MTDFIVAVPSKGRLQEQTFAFFSRAGLTILQPGGARNYRGRIVGLDKAEVAFLSASEIASELALGKVHLGVTGEDLVREQIPDRDRKITLITTLGFGRADVVVAVPKAWIDVRTMADLDDVAAGFRAKHGRRLRLATKYVNITRQFFAEHGIADYRIVESLGATEGAPASGAADLIVDITSTGSTLEANNLRVLDDGVMLKSEANLVVSLTADWNGGAKDMLEQVLQRVAAEAVARNVREIRATVGDQARYGREAVSRFGCRLPFGAVGGAGLLVLHCPNETVWDCVSWLKHAGAETVTVSRLDYIFESEGKTLAALRQKIS